MSPQPHSSNCPYCAAAMRATAMECPLCGVEVRGKFQQTLFQLLSGEEQQLLEDYLLAGFSIKDLARESGMGYAAIRSRLDRLIERYQRLREGEEEKKRILEQVAAGKLSATDAARLIAKIRGI